MIRVWLMGGIDPEYREEPSELLIKQREYLATKLQAVVPDPQSAILVGMILGQTDQLPREFKKDLQDTSTIHLLVVSGQNLTILAGFLMSLVYLVGRRQTAALTILAIIGYCLLSGMGVPVIRAAMMASAGLLAQILGRDMKGWWILLLTAGLMLLYNPNWLISISFQLSFMATLGVIVVAPILMRYLYRLPIIIREDLAITTGAYFLTLPIIAYNFYQISLVGIASNLLVGWTSPIIMVVGVATILASLINQFLGMLLGIIPTILLTYFIYVVEFFANYQYATIKVGQTKEIFWLGYYLMIVAIVMFLKTKADKMVNNDKKIRDLMFEPKSMH